MACSQAEYEQYQERKAEVRDWGHEQIQKIYEEISRKIAALYEEFHSNDDDSERS